MSNLIELAERDRNTGQECQAVWRCAVGDVVTALDVLKDQWLASRRKAEREAGAQLSAVLNLVWGARNPAPTNYDEANAVGRSLLGAVRALLARAQEETPNA